MIISFEIDGAAAFCDIEKENQESGEVRYKLPKVNDDYMFGAITDELPQYNGRPFLLCAKEGEQAGIALSVRIKGKDYSITDFKDITIAELFQLIRN